MLEAQVLAEWRPIAEWKTMVTAVLSNEKTWSSFGINTAWALVLLTNSTSAQCECLYMTTKRHSPGLIGPQRSIATSFQGSLGRSDICSGECLYTGVTGLSGSVEYRLPPFRQNPETRHWS